MHYPHPHQHRTTRVRLYQQICSFTYAFISLPRFTFTKIDKFLDLGRNIQSFLKLYHLYYHSDSDPPVGGVCLHVSRPRGCPEARGRGAHEGGALAQRPACHHHALRPEAARPPHPQAGASYLPAECYSPPRPAQHYYPEGGWGWCVAMASVLVNILAHGLQVTRLDRSYLC